MLGGISQFRYGDAPDLAGGPSQLNKPASGDLHQVRRPSETNEFPPDCNSVPRPASGPIGVVSPGGRHGAAGCRRHPRRCSSGLLG